MANINQNPKKNDPKNNDPKKNNKKLKSSQTITFWLVILLIIILMFQMNRMGNGKIKEITYSEFITMAERGEIKKVGFDNKNVIIENFNEQKYETYLPFEDPDLVKRLTEKGINVFSKKPSQLLGILISWFPFLLLIGVWFFIMRGMRGGAGQAFSFGKSRARLAIGGETKITFKDVAGVDEAKEELEEIVEFLKAPKKFQKLGGRIPRGVLLLGRPGTGKTLLAKAVAGEAKVPFFSISGSDFVEMFVGVGASRVRDMFMQAKKNAPCIAFIDEIDAVGRHRGTGLGGGHDEREQTLNQLLVEMDGFDPNDSVIIIAATNRPDVLDPALLRPGRFDRQVIVDLPDIKGREEILKVHTRKLMVSKEVSLTVIARVTPGFSGADLANLVNEAALLAARKNKKTIEMEDFDEAKDKVTLGKARKSKVITEADKKITAIHEVGHVLCSMFLDKMEPIHKVTIIPRGFSGGATHFMETDKIYYTKSYMKQTLVALLGGRAAEQIIFDEISTGAAYDIESATNLARDMVCTQGMSDKIGPITVAKKESQVFLGRDFSKHDNISEETARLIDDEIRKLITEAYDNAFQILKDHKKLLEIMAKELLEKETLEADQIYLIAQEQVKPEEKEFITSKFKKVQDMKIDLSQKDFKEPKKRKKPADEANHNDLSNSDSEVSTEEDNPENPTETEPQKTQKE
jgi:cell division protease FtsH